LRDLLRQVRGLLAWNQAYFAELGELFLGL
jgi:hypothetical protein